MTKQKIYATSDGDPTFKKFNKYTDKEHNYNFSKEGVAAALNAMHEQSCTDYSNGATHWDGIDAGQSGRKWAHSRFKISRKAGRYFWARWQ